MSYVSQTHIYICMCAYIILYSCIVILPHDNYELCRPGLEKRPDGLPQHLYLSVSQEPRAVVKGKAASRVIYGP